MAVVPNLWGLWNILYVALLARRRISLGLFGRSCRSSSFPRVGLRSPRGVAVPSFVPHALPSSSRSASAIYYLVWKHLVGALNAIVGLPE